MAAGKSGSGLIEINSQTHINTGELWFEFSHSSGPGGQNVNKVSSRVTLCFNPQESACLKDSQKRMIAARLSNRINQDGILKVNCDESRSQNYNRELVVVRFAELLADALKRQKMRKKTRPTRASRERRLEGKRQRSKIKEQRRDEHDL